MDRVGRGVGLKTSESEGNAKSLINLLLLLLFVFCLSPPPLTGPVNATSTKTIHTTLLGSDAQSPVALICKIFSVTIAAPPSISIYLLTDLLTSVHPTAFHKSNDDKQLLLWKLVFRVVLL